MRAIWTPALILTMVAVAVSQGGAADFHVAPSGNDDWSGKLAQPNATATDGPFATLSRARAAIRALKTQGPLPAGGITVELSGGTYELACPLELTAEDSGTENTPIIYRAAPGEIVRFVGGRVVSGWKSVADTQVLQRLAGPARGQVWQVDLKDLGISDLQGINSPGSYQSDPGLEVFFQDRPMTLARYPNAGYLHIAAALDANGNRQTGEVSSPDGKIVCDDPRLARWVDEKNIWLHGFWIWDWADMRVPLASVDAVAHTLTIGESAGRPFPVRTGQWFYAENALAELDSPGEWYLDRDLSILYFWPPAPLSAGQVVVSVTRDLVRFQDVSHVTLRGLIIEAGRGSACVIHGGDHVRIVGCTLRNLGNWAVRVFGGTQHGVVGCDIYQTGQGGIHLEGGDRKTLTPAGHYADNNHIHHIYDVATPILIGGGRDNVMTNNLFIQCGRAFSLDARGLGWAKGVGEFATRELHSLSYQQPPWSVKYPELLNLLDDEPLAPKGNVMARNICWGGPWGWTEPKAEPFIKFENNLVDTDPRFLGQPPADFRLAADSPAKAIGFNPIPRDKIGVYASDERASWPVVSTLYAAPTDSSQANR